MSMAVFTIPDDKIGRRQPFVVPYIRVGVVEVKYHPADHTRTVDLHVGITNGVVDRAYNSSGFIITTAREVGRFTN